MSTKTFKKNANKILWVEDWIKNANPEIKEYDIYAEKYDSFRWICEIELPLINKTVSSISEKQVNAMLNATNRAAKLIKEYMNNHPELHIENNFKFKQWEIVSNEDGEFISLNKSKAWMHREAGRLKRATENSLEVIKSTIKKLNKINGSDKNLFIQVLDESLFDDQLTINEILKKVHEKICEEYKTTSISVFYDKFSGNVISFGYTHPIPVEDKY